MDQSLFFIPIIFIAVAVHVGLSFLVGNIARNKGYSFGGFFAISFFLSFILGLIIVLVITPKPESQMTLDTSVAGLRVGPVQCAYCRELVRPDAVVCKHCGKDIEPVIKSAALTAEAQAKLASVTNPKAIKRQVEEQNPTLAKKRKILTIAVWGEFAVLVVSQFVPQVDFIGYVGFFAMIVTGPFLFTTEKKLKRLGEELRTTLAKDLLEK